jgi:steroid 5-alpha reductase family enzyme
MSGISLTIGVALGVEALLFFLVWMLSVRVRNYALLDVAFSYGLLPLIGLYAGMGSAIGPRFVAFSLVAAVWSLRLGTHILRRVLRHHPEEDIRYRSLRERWNGPWMFLLFFELQAALVVLFSLPVLLSAFESNSEVRLLEWVGLGISLVGVAGESLADYQMELFKRRDGVRESVCEVGLWRYSRHPNYFFESLVWVGFWVASLQMPLGWVTILCPGAMLYFILRVTGIPLTEEYAVKTKGEAYRAYQRSTSAFVPWFRKG